MKRFLVNCQPIEDDLIEECKERWITFLVNAPNKRYAKEMVTKYLFIHQEIEIGSENKYVLVAEKAKEGTTAKYEVPDSIASFDDKVFCDECGTEGAFHFGGRNLCENCTGKEVLEDYNVH